MEKTRAAHSIFEVYKGDMSSQLLNTTAKTYAEIILNDDLCQPQTDCAFHYLVSLSKKYKSCSVDDAAMHYFTKRMADVIKLKIGLGNNCSGDEPETFEDLIDYEIDRYKIKFIQLLGFYHILFISNNSRTDTNSNNTQPIPEIGKIGGPQFEILYNEIFNWEKRDNTIGNLESDEYNKPNKNIYLLTLGQLTHLDSFFPDKETLDIVGDLDNMLTAFVRYFLYRHANLHTICNRHLELTAEIYSDIYADNLRKRFVKTSCADF